MFGKLEKDAQSYRYAAIACYCSIMLLGGFAINIIGAAGPALTSNIHSSISAVGTIFSAEGIGNMIGSAVVGSVLDRHTGHDVICVLSLLMFAVVGLVPACESISQVLALYFLVGACMGMMSMTANMLVTWVQHGHNVGPWVNLVNSCFGIGASGAPLLFMLVERRLGNGLASFTAIGIFAFLPACTAWLLQSPPRPVKEVVDADEVQSLRGIGMSKRRSTICGVDMGSRERYIRCTVLCPIMLVMVLVIGAEMAYTAWIYSYATIRVGMRSEDAAYLNSSFWMAFTVGRMCMVLLAACFTPGMLLVPGLSLNLLSMLLILNNPASSTCLWVGTIGAGFGVCGCFSNAISLMASYDLLTSKTTGAIGAAAAVGHMTLPNFIGLAIQHTAWHYDALIRLNVIANAAGLLLITAVVVHLSRNFTSVSHASGRTFHSQYRTGTHDTLRVSSDELERATNVL